MSNRVIYTSQDKQLLEKILKKFPIVENKKTNRICVERKSVAWRKICAEYNKYSSSGIRSVIQLQRCWDKLKRYRRRQLAEEYYSTIQTDGESPVGLEHCVVEVTPHLICNDELSFYDNNKKLVKIEGSSKTEEASKHTDAHQKQDEESTNAICTNDTKMDSLMQLRLEAITKEIKHQEEIHKLKMEIERYNLERSKIELEIAKCKLHVNDRVIYLLEYIITSGENACKQFIDFLRDNELLHSLVVQLDNDIKDDAVEIAFVRGGFPELPRNYVVRQALSNEIKQRLLNLKWSQKLIIHGMTGYGKSCLVANVFKDKAVMEQFNYSVFWVNLGEHQNNDNLLSAMWNLYSNIITLVGDAPLSHCPKEIEKLKDCMKRVFLHERLKSSLLILDDVTCPEVIDAFDFKSRLVVTTHHKDIVNQLKAYFVEVKTGFSLAESIELFKKTLDVSQVCPQAEILHTLGKGFPMFMALVSSFLLSCREEAVSSSKIWEDLINEFSEKSLLTGKINDKAIEMCVQRLPPTLREYYFDLSIFDEDVNIMPKVLENLWHISRNDVRKIMVEFANKSLIVPYFHKKFGSYVYGLHDLHVHYLRRNCENLQQRHQKLIDSYRNVINGNFAHLPNDNYILSYIGYHLKHSGYHSTFSIYYDLKFLEAKIKAVGYKDVLRDMDLYKCYITEERPILQQKLNDYTQFLEMCGSDLFNYKTTDIIQFALQENKKSFVYNAAMSYVENNADLLYFHLDVSYEKSKTSVIKLNEDISSACYTDNNDSILVGTSSGQILKYYQEEEYDSFTGHSGKILSLQLSPDKKSFLSLSDDNTVKWWQLKPPSCRNSLDSSNGIPSPKYKQCFWENIHMLDEKHTATTTFRMKEIDDFIVCAAFANDFAITRQIVTGSNRGKIIIWDAVSCRELISTTPRGLPAKSVLFLDEYVTFCCGDDIFLFQRDEEFSFFTKFSNRNFQVINSLLPVHNGRQIVTVCENSVTLWNYIDNAKLDIFASQTKIDSVAITNDSRYIVIGNEGHFIYVYDLILKKIVDKLDGGHGITQCLDVCYDNQSLLILLIVLDNKTLKQYKIISHCDKYVLSAVHWSTTPLCAFVTSSNKLQLTSSTDEIFDTQIKSASVTVLTFSECGSRIVYGLADGNIISCDYKTNTYKTLTSQPLDGPVTFLRVLSFVDRMAKLFTMKPINCNNLEFIAACDTAIYIMKDVEVVKKLQNPLKEVNIYHKSCNYVVLVDTECTLTVINLDAILFKLRDEYCLHLLQKQKATTAVFYNDKYLAIGTDACRFVVFDVVNLKSPAGVMSQQLESKAICANFSSNGQLIALGLESGIVEVINLKTLENTRLVLHESPLKTVQFSDGFDSILVTVADQIAWWDLASLEDVDDSLSSQTLNLWTNKSKNRYTVPYLLACVKLYGTYVNFFSVSKEFNHYLVIDNESTIYSISAIMS